MPIYYDVESRSAAWFYLRAGRPTASAFHRLVTPKRLDVSAECEAYAYELLAELMLGRPVDDEFQNQWMQRGQDLEDAAYQAYEMHSELDTTRGGFVTVDDRTYGCSPDRLVGTDGGLEIKCNIASTHVRYLLHPEALELEKRIQVQGCLLVTERKWWDMLAFHPELPPVIRRVKRDEAVIDKLRTALSTFCGQLALMREKLELAHGKFPDIVIPVESRGPEEIDALGVSDADIDAIIAQRGGLSA